VRIGKDASDNRRVLPSLPQALAVALSGAALALSACVGGSGEHRGQTMQTRTTQPTLTAQSGVPSAAPAGDDPLAQTEATAQLVFASHFARDGAADPRYYEDGVWHGPDACWTCATGPAGLGAVLWAAGRLTDPAQKAAVVDTFDHAIATRQLADGSYGDDGNSKAINIAFFAPVLGNALLVLGDRLPAATRARWSRSLRRSSEFLAEHNELTWYVNGNINLAYALTLYVTWRATGDGRFRSLYQRELRFAISPPASRWKGHGLEIRRKPARADGADGRGFLSETGAGGTGYDPEYTYVQLDVLSRLYALSGDRSVLRLANLLTNQTLQNVNAKWNLLTTGTRHPQPNRYVPYSTPAIVVLGRLGANSALMERMGPQLSRTLELYRSTTTFTHQNFYRGADIQLGTMLLALLMRRPADASVLTLRRR
jgi:hypothetical protein